MHPPLGYSPGTRGRFWVRMKVLQLQVEGEATRFAMTPAPHWQDLEKFGILAPCTETPCEGRTGGWLSEAGQCLQSNSTPVGKDT